MENTKSNTLMTFFLYSRKVRKVKNLRNLLTVLNSQVISQSFPFFGRNGEKSKNAKTKSRKKKPKSRKVEKIPGQESYVRKVERLKIQKNKKLKNRKTEKSNTFLFFGETNHLKSRTNRKFEKSKPFDFLFFLRKKNAIFALCDHRREERLEFPGYPFSGRPHASFLVVRASWPSHVPLQK